MKTTRNLYASLLVAGPLMACSGDNAGDLQDLRDIDGAGTVVLHNGIVLPEEWPPRLEQRAGPVAMPVPYLDSPPDVIPVNTGRQLFVDDFLIQDSSLERVFHQPEEHHSNPVLEPSQAWEQHEMGAPYASPFSDGIWYDEATGKYRMWYLAGGGEYSPDAKAFVTAYAESGDGVTWTKPDMDVVPGTNIVDLSPRDSNVVWLDRAELDPQKRYKVFNVEINRINEQRYSWSLVLRHSGDGLTWSDPVAHSGAIGDRTTAYHDPFQDKWVISARSYGFGERRRQYIAHADPEEAVSLTHEGLSGNYARHVYDWFGAWPQDSAHPDFPDTPKAPAVYNHDGTPYESLMLGFFNVWQGPSNSVAAEHGIQKRNLIAVGYSRDGFHWDRPDVDVFIGDNRTDGAWNWGNIQSVAGGPLIVGDKLYFYASGRRKNEDFWDGYTSTGLFSLRRDGFASMRAEETTGTLTTRVLTFDGQHLFVNADVSGSLGVEVLDESGAPIEGYESLPVNGDSTDHLIAWPEDGHLGDLVGRDIRLRFTLENGDLFSFWVSPWLSGESRGATAGGGPGLHPSGWDRPLSPDQ